jgi:hypothetical protein
MYRRKEVPEMTEYRWILAEPTDTKEGLRYWRLEFNEVGGSGGEIYLVDDPLPEPFASFDRERFYTQEEVDLLDGSAKGPEKESSQDGVRVWWDRPYYRPSDLEAELPDGSRIGAVVLAGGQVGFDRLLPKGTPILLRGKEAWKTSS